MQYVVAGAGSGIENLGFGKRCTTASGDFFKAGPAADAYSMKSVLHDWGDERALTILQCCCRSGSKNAKVIRVETVIAPGNEPHMAKWLDIEMLLLNGGRERIEAEFAELFSMAGLRLTRVVGTKSPVSVIEAQKL